MLTGKRNESCIEVLLFTKYSMLFKLDYDYIPKLMDFDQTQLTARASTLHI